MRPRQASEATAGPIATPEPWRMKAKATRKAFGQTPQGKSLRASLVQRGSDPPRPWHRDEERARATANEPQGTALAWCEAEASQRACPSHGSDANTRMSQGVPKHTRGHTCSKEFAHATLERAARAGPGLFPRSDPPTDRWASQTLQAQRLARNLKMDRLRDLC